MIFISKVTDREAANVEPLSELVTTTYALTPECHFVCETYTDHLFTVVIGDVTHYLRGVSREACLAEAYALATAHHNGNDNGKTA